MNEWFESLGPFPSFRGQMCEAIEHVLNCTSPNTIEKKYLKVHCKLREVLSDGTSEILNLLLPLFATLLPSKFI